VPCCRGEDPCSPGEPATEEVGVAEMDAEKARFKPLKPTALCSCWRRLLLPPICARKQK